MVAMTVVARLVVSFNAWQTQGMLAMTVVARLGLSPLTLGKLE